MSLGDQIMYIARKATSAYWELPVEGYSLIIQVNRFEEIDADTWNAYYIIPNTGIEESVIVKRLGDRLYAYCGGCDTPETDLTLGCKDEGRR